MKIEHDRFMAFAIEEAEIGIKNGERPFGSVVVRDGKVVGRGHNRVNSTLDPTAHAETLAIRNAAANLKEARLTGCTLYTTCEPCPMCCGATLYAGVDTLVIGAPYASVRQISQGKYDLRDYTADRLIELTGLKLKVLRGVMQEECEAIYRNWQGWAAISP